MSTALSSRVLVVCLQIERSRSTISCLIADEEKNLSSIGLRSFNMNLNMSYFPNITVFAKFGI